jgi:hypothetical protein
MTIMPVSYYSIVLHTSKDVNIFMIISEMLLYDDVKMILVKVSLIAGYLSLDILKP